MTEIPECFGGIIAYAGKDYIVVATDITIGDNTTDNDLKSNNKIFQLTKTSVLASTSGHLFDDYVMIRSIRLYMEMYYLEHFESMKTQNICEMFSNLFFNQTFFTSNVVNFVSTFNLRGEAVIYRFDQLGRYTRLKYKACGPLAKLLHSILEDQLYSIKDDKIEIISLTKEEAVTIIYDAFLLVFLTDTFNSNGVQINIITKDGVEEMKYSM